MPQPNASQRRPLPLPVAVALIAVLGAAVLLIAQFAPLYHAYATGIARPIASGSVGATHSWALVPIAILAGVFGLAVLTVANRGILVAIGALGLISVIIGLSHDLPQARASGIRAVGSHYLEVANSVAAGLYLEMAGGLLLLIAAVGGLLLLSPSPATRAARAALASRRRERAQAGDRAQRDRLGAPRDL
jgi:hypothetical protein